MMNKKGITDIVILVLLAVLMFSAALFSFASSSKSFQTRIIDANLINSVYIREGEIKSYINDVGGRALVLSYKDFVKNADYMAAPSGNPLLYGGRKGFGAVSSDAEIGNKLGVLFKSNFEKEFSKNVYADKLINVPELLKGGNYQTSYSNGVFSFVLSGVKIEDSSNSLKISYSPEIKVDFNLTRMGLHSFSDIYVVKEKCKSDLGKMQECLKGLLPNFDVVASYTLDVEDKDFIPTTVDFTTKKQFLVDDKFEQINFGFVIP